ncbi:MAG TPA: hypothetical protein PLI90_04650, partial [Rhodocyclaceae bacterium]|nr:hypothetical protein [Rhodocyclaceae bacterium]
YTAVGCMTQATSTLTRAGRQFVACAARQAARQKDTQHRIKLSLGALSPMEYQQHLGVAA